MVTHDAGECNGARNGGRVLEGAGECGEEATERRAGREGASAGPLVTKGGSTPGCQRACVCRSNACDCFSRPSDRRLAGVSSPPPPQKASSWGALVHARILPIPATPCPTAATTRSSLTRRGTSPVLMSLTRNPTSTIAMSLPRQGSSVSSRIGMLP